MRLKRAHKKDLNYVKKHKVNIGQGDFSNTKVSLEW
jgi:hypothetical protein